MNSLERLDWRCTGVLHCSSWWLNHWLFASTFLKHCWLNPTSAEWMRMTRLYGQQFIVKTSVFSPAEPHWRKTGGPDSGTVHKTRQCRQWSNVPLEIWRKKRCHLSFSYLSLLHNELNSVALCDNELWSLTVKANQPWPAFDIYRTRNETETMWGRKLK